METILAATVVLAHWTLPSFLSKKTLHIISPQDMTLNKWFIGGLISLCILILLGNKYDFTNNKKTYKQTFMIVVLTMLANISYYTLLTKYDASTLMIVLNPINILLAAVIGRYMYGEKINQEMWLGVGVIIGGLVLFLKGKRQIK